MQLGDSSKRLTVDRIFTADEFQEEKLDHITWSKLGGAYFTLRGAPGTGQDLIRVDARLTAGVRITAVATARRGRAIVRTGGRGELHSTPLRFSRH